MDFHFYEPSKKVSNNKSPFSKSFLAFIPLFILAALLPVSLALVKTPVTSKFQSEAALNDLTIWFSPSSVTGTVSKPITLTVFAHFESDKLLPGLRFPISVDGPASIENAEISTITPFNGQVSIGTVKIIPFRKGKVTVKIDPNKVKSPTFTGIFNTSTSVASITVE